MIYLQQVVLLIISCYFLNTECTSDYTTDEDPTDETEVDVIEGDILFYITKYDEGTQGAAVHSNRVWTNATLPYQISEEYDKTQVEEIKFAMEAFENKTCITFKERKNETLYINIVKKTSKRAGCFSPIGCQGRRAQVLILSDECIVSPGTVKHELMHAVGFAHEQSRTDRDDHVKIHYGNIINGTDNNDFKRYGENLIRLLNTSYDIKSIMQYKWNEMAIDRNLPTITANDGQVIERAEDFSRTDILEINRLYKCDPGQYSWGPSDNGQIQQANNCSFFGQDIHHQECSSEECTALCLANSLCTHFTWDSEDNCYLSTSSSFIDIYPYKGAICGHIIQRHSNYSWRDWKDGKIKWAPRCDFFGLDFHQQKTGYKECGELCLNNTKCTHFTWEWEGNCYLKTLSKTVNVYPYEKSICGYVNRRDSIIPWQDGENKQLKWAKDCDFFGYDFHQAKSKDKECGGLCLSYTKCTHFTWDWEGNCHLKAAPNSTAAYPFKGAVCGYVTRRQTANLIWKDRNSGKIKWARGCDFFGYDISEKKSKEEKCSGLCLANQNCSHFTWDPDGNCYLKNAPKSVSMYPFKGAVCGYIAQQRN